MAENRIEVLRPVHNFGGNIGMIGKGFMVGEKLSKIIPRHDNGHKGNVIVEKVEKLGKLGGSEAIARCAVPGCKQRATLVEIDDFSNVVTFTDEEIVERGKMMGEFWWEDIK